MNPDILNTEVQEFIVEKSNAPIDLNALILKGSPFEHINIKELAQQIKGRLTAKNKIPSWFTKRSIYYPPTLNLEQTSSEATAIYKSQLVSGETLIDVTGGLGIDDYFFSKKVNHITHCELNTELSKIATHNFAILQAENIKTIANDGLKVLEDMEHVDWIYIDPSRRHDHKGKVFFLEDCLPNVPAQLDFLFSKSTNILIKTSPLLDIQSGINSLQYVKEIHVVAVENEVKELLWLLDGKTHKNILVKTINIRKKGDQLFSFYLEEEHIHSIDYGFPKKFLYEPNAAILKSGGFQSVAHQLELVKLHQHSHLYTSDNLFNFPGRCFEIISVLPYHKKNISKAGFTKANITTRNFPETVSSLRKKLKIKDGGNDYLFFTTDKEENKLVIHCRKATIV
ncbi:class I SAM-dependent methyltransferase [Aquimarina sp. D1M17]|uniref:class I SAM-dependent methyltransferase n=1 Tax=Aquimarina acroporae TaxID=2937283 RepID=UPI0020BEE979|nr:class I SAM-dependent methyltransferase [Aquimarina acroporae]MCK8520720.1 class I SAM-dependent methyltransferase [Aquimarina acroporae]